MCKHCNDGGVYPFKKIIIVDNDHIGNAIKEAQSKINELSDIVKKQGERIKVLEG